MSGVNGVIRFNQQINPNSVSNELFHIMFGNQNRGQGAVKIITQMINCQEPYNQGRINYEELRYNQANYLFSEFASDGLVRSAINNGILSGLYGDLGIGAVSNEQLSDSNSLPARTGLITLCKDGYLKNTDKIKDFLISAGYTLTRNSGGSEVLAKLLNYHYVHTSLEDCINRDGIEAMTRCLQGYEEAPAVQGDLAIIAMTPQGLLACVTDIKPLGFTLLNNRAYVYSETTGPWSITPCINTRNFSDYIHDLMPGELIEINRSGNLRKKDFNQKGNLCSFEWAYFGKPSSVFRGKEVAEARRDVGYRMGPLIWKNMINHGYDQNYIKKCIVVPTLSSGEWYAKGISESMSINYVPALFKDKYSLKSFILPNQKNREEEVMMKLIPSAFQLKDANVILVEDSIVRGTTMRETIKLLKNKAGSNDIHVVPCFPMKVYYCPSIPNDKDKLMAEGMTVDQMNEIIGSNTLTFGDYKIWLEVVGPQCYKCINIGNQ